jgi:hypothetical protein
MRNSQLQAWLEQQKAEHGDIETACMTAPFGIGETEVLSQEFLQVSTDQPSNGKASTSQVLYTSRNGERAMCELPSGEEKR